MIHSICHLKFCCVYFLPQVTFALVWAAAAKYAHSLAPPGAGAMAQTLLGAGAWERVTRVRTKFAIEIAS